MNYFFEACKNNDIDRVSQFLNTLSKDKLNERDSNNRTALHLAAFHGHMEILRLLLSHKDIDRFIPNQWGSFAKDEAPDDLKFLFDKIPIIDEDDNDIEEPLEWFDTYTNAYRIAYECHNYLNRWLTKISFARLVEEINNGYINNIDFGNNKIDEKILIENYMKKASQDNDPISMIRAYTEKTRFVTKLNEDLAIDGSDFRFKINFTMLNTFYHDNDPPKDFGHYIFVAILSHHSKLQSFRHYTGKTYRGVNMKKNDLDQYEEGKSILTRTFLSSSTDQTVAQSFLNNDQNLYFRVICIYQIRDPKTVLDLHTISVYPQEKEILIIPFTTFKIININKSFDNITYIELDQCVIETIKSKITQ